MEKAKQAVAKLVSRDGKHTTEVDEDVRQAVTDEQVRPHRHEHVTTAVDKEVHQDHHHTTVQPLKAKEVLSEQHTHNELPVEQRNVVHDDVEGTQAELTREAAKYNDSSVTHETTHSASAGQIEGERTYHHVHEHIQPVIHKDVVAPEVVHTTAPVHEKHHVAVNHGTSVLPAKSVEDFMGSRGTIKEGSAKKVGEFEGSPNLELNAFNSENMAKEGVVEGTH